MSQATDARTFTHGHSMAHSTFLEQVAQEKGCTCKPYVDWFTYRRWQAQGYQVQRGEKGTKLTVFVPCEKTEVVKGKEITKSYTRPKYTTVFCRHQVKAKGQ